MKDEMIMTCELFFSHIFSSQLSLNHDIFKMFVWGGLNFKSRPHLCRCFMDVLQYLISIVEPS